MTELEQLKGRLEKEGWLSPDKSKLMAEDALLMRQERNSFEREKGELEVELRRLKGQYEATMKDCHEAEVECASLEADKKALVKALKKLKMGRIITDRTYLGAILRMTDIATEALNLVKEKH